jgi:hypothetical protein
MADEALNAGITHKGSPGRPAGKENALDVFLKSSIGGKYKWRRYEFFEDYLIRCRKMTKASAGELIAKLKITGVGYSAYPTLLSELREWKRICAAQKGSKGGRAKAKEYPKWSQERRKEFNLKRLERGLTKKRVQ